MHHKGAIFSERRCAESRVLSLTFYRACANTRPDRVAVTWGFYGIAMTYLRWCFLFSLKLFGKEKNYMNCLIDLEAGGVN